MTKALTATLDEFHTRTDRAIVDACNAGASDLRRLLPVLRGSFPSVVLERVKYLASAGRISESQARAILESSKRPAGIVINGRHTLPPPHPLDFEWRFTAEAARELVMKAESLSAPGDVVLLLGTPNVALEAIGRRNDRRIVFVGEDNAVTNTIKKGNAIAGCPIRVLHCAEAGSTIGEVAVVVLDPPWYLDYMRPMLATATAVCRTGGHILISLPPEGASASAGEDRAAVFRYAENIGLEVVESQLDSVKYDTPYFEQNSLVAQNCDAPPNWRAGDLVIFRKKHALTTAAWAIKKSKSTWREIQIGRMRLRVKVLTPTNTTMTDLLGKIVDGDILPSVKRSDPRRRRAKVFTSGNRVFRSVRPDLVVEAAIHAANIAKRFGTKESEWKYFAANDDIEALARTLRKLAMVEEAEECGQRESKSAYIQK